MTSTTLRAALLALFCVAGAGCEDKGIGARCSLDSDAGVNTETTNINALAFECPSRICLAQSPFAGASDFGGIAPLCTATCESSDDCSDGKTGKADMGLCPSGFVCAVSTTVGPFACKKMCICKQYFPQNESGGAIITPPSSSVCP